MNKRLMLSVIILNLLSGTVAHAQEAMNHMAHMNHQQHMAMMNNDARQLVDFPAPMQEHTLSNMRDHLQALSDILTSMGQGQYAKAGQIARDRLGMDSPSADGCAMENSASQPQMSTAASMDQQMALLMPENMRNLGFNMHQAASAFADQAAKAAKTHNPKPALAALSKVTEQCAACHAAYKLR